MIKNNIRQLLKLMTNPNDGNIFLYSNKISIKKLGKV